MENRKNRAQCVGTGKNWAVPGDRHMWDQGPLQAVERLEVLRVWQAALGTGEEIGDGDCRDRRM